jgi:hypothetical protein
MKKSKCSKRVHLWLSDVPPLAFDYDYTHLILMLLSYDHVCEFF